MCVSCASLRVHHECELRVTACHSVLHLSCVPLHVLRVHHVCELRATACAASVSCMSLCVTARASCM